MVCLSMSGFGYPHSVLAYGGLSLYLRRFGLLESLLLEIYHKVIGGFSKVAVTETRLCAK